MTIPSNQIEKVIKDKNTINLTTQKHAKHYLLLACHHPTLDPRLRWIVEGAPSSICVHILGINKPNQVNINAKKTNIDSIEVTIPYNINPHAWLKRTNSSSIGKGYCQGQLELALLAAIAHMEDEKISQLLGEIKKIDEFRSYLDFFIKVNSALYSMGLNFNNLSGIISCDLYTVPAGIMLKNKFNIPLVYDAQEFWPYSIRNATQCERNFWSDMEKRLLSSVDIVDTVTEPLAQHLKQFYEKDFLYVPNCELKNATSFVKSEEDKIISHLKKKNKTLFLFQGAFAPQRGIELLINIWHNVDEDAVLILRGPDTPYKEEQIQLARSKNLLDKRIFFPKPVSESELVSAASLCDVGLIPYEPARIDLKYCGPNKLSQYLAAGLPIISNNLVHVKEILRQSESGIAIDFSNHHLLINTINHMLVDVEGRKKYAANALHFFKNSFHWENMSKVFYEKLDAIAKPQYSIVFHCKPSLNLTPYESKPSRPSRLKLLWNTLPISLRLKLSPFLKKLFNIGFFIIGKFKLQKASSIKKNL